jgi:hypothetical protein
MGKPRKRRGKRGGSRGGAKMTLHDLSREMFSEEDHPALRQELFAGTDRSSALVACAMVDAALVMALKSRLIPMAEAEFKKLFYRQGAVLGSLSARIQLGQALGIYGPKMTAMLDAIRNVRNAFAHAVKPIGFDHELVAKECAPLPDERLSVTLATPLLPDRERYIAACMILVNRLEDHAARHSGDSFQVEFD